MIATTEHSEDSYIFSRNSNMAVIRLNYQHWLQRRFCGYLIHPSIPKDANMRVADVGAGSGIWATEVLEQLGPTSRANAIDISDAQFPARCWVPQNLHFLMHDCFKPFDEELVGQFNLVNVRFFLTNVTPGTLGLLLQNIMTLLKPGGYIQWYDPDMSTTTVTTGSLSFPTPAVDKLVSVMKKPTPNTDSSFVANLDKTFAEQGLDVVAFERYPMRDALRPIFCHTQVMGYEALCEHLEECGQTEAAKAARDHLHEVRQEFKNGAALAQEFICCVGRKSST